MNALSPLLLLATVVLVILKVAGVIAWPWIAVLVPAIVLAVLFLVGLVGFIAIAVAADRLGRK